MKITAELLEKYGDNCRELDEFRKRFPFGVDTETVDPADLVGFDLHWFAGESLYKVARVEYLRARRAASAEKERIRGPALTEYMWESDATLAEYLRIRKAAWYEYDLACASALVRIVNEHGLKPPTQEETS